MRSAYPICLCALWWNCHVSVLTYHNDLARTGQNLRETELTPASVSSGQFGPLFSYPVDGEIYAQPLYVPGILVPGQGIHNVVFVATEHDSVYAFDADNGLSAPLWHVSFLDAAQNVIAAQASELQCGSITPELGITATPVIDPATNTLYVVAMSEEAQSGQFVHRLHALDAATGAEKPGSPVEIQASAPGSGDGNGTVEFKPWLYKERAGLLLLNHTVYTAWSSQCDSGDYHGWLIGYDAATLRQTSVFVTTPNAWAGALWQGGAAPAADSNGNLYLVSANGIFDADRGGSDFGESILKLSAGNLAASDYFTPYNAESLSDQDIDLGSSGALLLPDEAGSAAHPHLLVTGSKAGTVYLVDRDRLGHFQPDNNNQIVESLTDSVGPLFGIPAYFHNRVYFSAAHDQVKAFSIHDGLLSPAPDSASSSTMLSLGSVPSISANGVSGGILWTIAPNGQLLAYDASDVSQLLYQGNTGSFVKFSTPTVANGKVYVGTATQLLVFGLKQQNPAIVSGVVSADGSSGPVAAGSDISLFGSNLALHPASANGPTWPKVLEGVSLFLDGTAVPLGYVSPGQINAEVPADSKPGRAVLTLVTGGRVLAPIGLTVRSPLR